MSHAYAKSAIILLKVPSPFFNAFVKDVKAEYPYKWFSVHEKVRVERKMVPVSRENTSCTRHSGTWVYIDLLEFAVQSRIARHAKRQAKIKFAPKYDHLPKMWRYGQENFCRIDKTASSIIRKFTKITRKENEVRNTDLKVLDKFRKKKQVIPSIFPMAMKNTPKVTRSRWPTFATLWRHCQAECEWHDVWIGLWLYSDGMAHCHLQLHLVCTMTAAS